MIRHAYIRCRQMILIRCFDAAAATNNGHTTITPLRFDFRRHYADAARCRLRWLFFFFFFFFCSLLRFIFFFRCLFSPCLIYFSPRLPYFSPRAADARCRFDMLMRCHAHFTYALICCWRHAARQRRCALEMPMLRARCDAIRAYAAQRRSRAYAQARRARRVTLPFADAACRHACRLAH